jgi:ribosomal protein L22
MPAPRKKARTRSAEPKKAPEPVREPSRPVVRAQAKYVRCSARKARLVIEHIRGRSVEDARAVLRHTPRGVAVDLEKLLKSAVANAENNHDLVGDDLMIKEVYADEGPTIKRFRPRALGRATRIRKRTSHLTLTLTPKD